MQEFTCYDVKNARGYLEPQWSIFYSLQERKVRKTMNLIKESVLKNGVSVYFQGKLLHFDCVKQDDLNIDFSFKQMPKGTLGEHDSETGKINFNESLRFDGPRMFATIYHEYSHEIQRALVKHINEYEKDSLEYQYLCLLEIEHKTKALKSFGINCEGEPYISLGFAYDLPSNSQFRTKKLISALYQLQMMERNAFATEVDAYNYLKTLDNQRVKDIEISNQKESVQYIRDEYGVPGLSYDEICNLIDTAKLNIINQKPPSQNNDIEASITYDMIILLKLKGDLYKDAQKAIGDYERLEKMEVKKQTLYNFYKDEGKRFILDKNERVGEYEFVNDIIIPEYFDAEMLGAIDREAQIRNPEMIVAALFFSREEAIPFIKDIEAFKIWYYSNANKQSPRTQIMVSEILGPEFSPEVRKIKNQEFNQNFLKEHPEYSKGITHKNEDCHVQKYRLNEKHDVPPWEPTPKNESKNKSAIEPEI